MLNNFKLLLSGKIPIEMLSMLNEIVVDGHNDHAKNIADGTSIEDVLGLKFKTYPSIYKPNITSSSMLLLKNILRRKNNWNNVLDLGSGSGVIGLSLLNQKECENITMADINKVAIRCIRENSIQLNKPEKISIIYSDLFSNINNKYDAIIFNLPLSHKGETTEEELALTDIFGNLAIKFFNESRNYLNENGEIWFTYSNISKPEILEDAMKIWNISLVSAEFVAEGGIWFFVYKAKLK